MPTLIQRFAVLSGFVLASLSAAHAGGSLPGPGYDGMPDRSLGSFGKVVVAFPGDLPLQFGYLVDLAVLLGAPGWQSFLARHSRHLERAGSLLAAVLLLVAAVLLGG